MAGNNCSQMNNKVCSMFSLVSPSHSSKWCRFHRLSKAVPARKKTIFFGYWDDRMITIMVLWVHVPRDIKCRNVAPLYNKKMGCGKRQVTPRNIAKLRQIANVLSNLPRFSYKRLIMKPFIFLQAMRRKRDNVAIFVRRVLRGRTHVGEGYRKKRKSKSKEC